MNYKYFLLGDFGLNICSNKQKFALHEFELDSVECIPSPCGAPRITLFEHDSSLFTPHFMLSTNATNF